MYWHSRKTTRLREKSAINRVEKRDASPVLGDLGIAFFAVSGRLRHIGISLPIPRAMSTSKAAMAMPPARY
jgi:hypothetical protein